MSSSEEKEALAILLKSKFEILQKNSWFTITFDLNTLQLLGKGSFGVVFSAYHINFKRKIAFKMIESEMGELKQTIDELLKMKTLKHPGILEILDYQLIMHNKLLVVVLIMEQGQMSLKDYFTEKPMGMSEPLLCQTMNALSSAISYAHQNKIVHCDIKPGNIILFQNKDAPGFKPKISDWGSAYEFKEFNHNSATKRKDGMFFTPMFLAPELHIFEDEKGKNKAGNFFAGDVYALGVTLLCCAGIEMSQLGGLAGEQDKECYEMKMKKLLKQLKDKGISEETVDKINRMIAFEPKERILPFIENKVIIILYNFLQMNLIFFITYDYDR